MLTVSAAANANPKGVARILSWRRVKVVFVASMLLSVLLMPGWKLSYVLLWSRFLFAGLILLLTFGLFEVWPVRLPTWFARWALQVLAVAFAVPFTVFAAYSLTTIGLQPAWWHDPDRLSGFGGMTVLGLLSAPWIVVAALLRQIRGEAERQGLAFDLERSEFERQALDARLRLLQAQIEPHFLFNTRRRHSRRNSISCAPISKSCTCACPTGCNSRCTQAMRCCRCSARR